MLVFTNVIYNAKLHHWYTTKNNKFLKRIFAVVMLLHLTFETNVKMSKSQNKSAITFFPNSEGCFSEIKAYQFVVSLL